MTNCPSCKAKNAENRNFCGSCGAPVARCCASCGFRNLLTDRFCGGCGTGLGAVAAAPRTHEEELLLPVTQAREEFAHGALPKGGEDELIAAAAEFAVDTAEPEDAKVSQDDIDSLFGV